MARRTEHAAGSYVHKGKRGAFCPVEIHSAGGHGTMKCYACGKPMVKGRYRKGGR